ncbi:MAG: alpha/beta hydrolase [Oscillospiraceae bacterium]|jgi:acetyl esterase/lipase|nr:alpha/beta hydrolase [Oscillospiraceae bacterium]
MKKTSRPNIRPELRMAAARMRILLPIHSVWKTKIAKAACALMRGTRVRGIRNEQIYVTRGDGSRLRLCVYAPLEPRENVIGLLWIHGGGYAIGAPEMDIAYIRRFIDVSGCVVVSPDYTLSLDAPYPAALDDCYAALMWLRANGERYGMRSDQIFVGGDSAGGGLAAAVSLYARDRGEVCIAFQMPLYPMLDDRATPSNTDNHAPIWDSKSNEMCWKLYLGALYGTDAVPAYAAPARATENKGLPPTCTFVGSIEPFRDEVVTYCENLRNAGVDVHFHEFEDCYHGFDVIGGKASVSREATAFLMDTFGYAVQHYFAAQSEV